MCIYKTNTNGTFATLPNANNPKKPNILRNCKDLQNNTNEKMCTLFKTKRIRNVALFTKQNTNSNGRLVHAIFGMVLEQWNGTACIVAGKEVRRIQLMRHNIKAPEVRQHQRGK